MKKSLCAILVIVLSFVGANALAAKFDFIANLKTLKSSSDTSASANGRGVNNAITKRI